MSPRIGICVILFFFLQFFVAPDRVEAGPIPKSLDRNGQHTKSVHAGSSGVSTSQSLSAQTLYSSLSSSTPALVSSLCTLTATLSLPVLQTTVSSTTALSAASSSTVTQSGPTTTRTVTLSAGPTSPTPVPAARAVSISLPTGPTVSDNSTSSSQSQATVTGTFTGPSPTITNFSTEPPNGCITVTETHFVSSPATISTVSNLSTTTSTAQGNGFKHSVPPPTSSESSTAIVCSNSILVLNMTTISIPGQPTSTPKSLPSVPSVSNISTSTNTSVLECDADGSMPIASITSEFGVRIGASGVPTLSSSTTIFTTVSSMTVTSGSQTFTTVTPVIHTSVTLVPISSATPGAAPTGTLDPAISSGPGSRIQTTVITGSVIGVVFAVLIALGMCLIVRRLRRRKRHSTGSFFPAPYHSPAVATHHSNRSMRSLSVLSADPGIDIEEGETMQQVLDTLDLAGPALQVQTHGLEMLPTLRSPFLRPGKIEQDILVTPFTDTQSELDSSIVKGQSRAPQAVTDESVERTASGTTGEYGISGKSASTFSSSVGVMRERDWEYNGAHASVARSDITAPPDYASSSMSREPGASEKSAAATSSYLYQLGGGGRAGRQRSETMQSAPPPDYASTRSFIPPPSP
ncbi:hypothetical protein DFH07DRAFT_814065 [Mycena maculata]|uniref:Mid2 domain-containing protein n=1 Tax=Mycena maculata TaxID=230809 RepID=A0AAD7JDG2_9AGAR|nr:hypothetical protein DFH07DRAFT_814065 [Mycena maculata]